MLISLSICEILATKEISNWNQAISENEAEL